MQSPDVVEQRWTWNQVDLAHRWLDAIETAQEKAIEDAKREATAQRGGR